MLSYHTKLTASSSRHVVLFFLECYFLRDPRLTGIFSDTLAAFKQSFDTNNFYRSFVVIKLLAASFRP